MSAPKVDVEKFARESLARHYERQVGRVAQHLRELADRVERDGQARTPQHYVYAASTVVHDIQWGVANLPLESLICAAGDAQDNGGAS